jgi:hypothetical protein
MTVRLSTALPLLALVLCSPAGICSSDADSVPDLRFTEESFDFGCVGVDFKVFHTFELVNHGRDTINISNLSGHCDCTEVRFRDSTVAPGDTARIRIIFSTADMYGPVDKYIGVHSSDKKAPKQEVHYTANVGQWLFKIEPKPVSVFFLPNQNLKTATLVNHALDRISVQDIYLDSNIVDIKTTRSEADKGENLEFELVPKANIKAGAHLTNYTITVDLHQKDVSPLKITIPVKIVKF